jgi:hypothetical protein
MWHLSYHLGKGETDEDGVMDLDIKIDVVKELGVNAA